MRDRLDDIKKHGAELLAVDPHEDGSANLFLKEIGLKTGDVGYPLLLDSAQTVSAAYGVAFQMRIHPEWSTRPATFIIDREGVIRYERRGESFSDRPSPQTILAELNKLP